jgi:hypothetical protein
VKGLILIENSIFNSWRMEDVWLEERDEFDDEDEHRRSTR